jgi:S1-C subfamily serine protease
VTTLDWIIVAFTALMALFGSLRGFIVGALSLLGFAAGAIIGTRLGPLVLPGGSSSPYAPLFGVFGALLAGGILAGALEGAGNRLRSALRIPGVGLLDGLLGAVLTAAVALGFVWIGGAVALQTPGVAPQIRKEFRRSKVLRALNETLPPSGPILNALARFDPLPSIRGPGADVSAPTKRILRSPAARAAARSVVRVTGTACGLSIEGSGWAAGGGLVVTNAHVVAGEDDTSVQVGGTGARRSAAVVRVDAKNDIAVLRVDGLGVPALRQDEAAGSGAPVVVMGYPENGPFDARPARLAQTHAVQSTDAYGRGPVTRRITAFRGRVRPGNSGGPLVLTDGRVAATVFAATVGAAHPSGYGVPVSVVRRELHAAAGVRGSVSTGPCGNE